MLALSCLASYSAQEESDSPDRLSPAVITGPSNGACPSSDSLIAQNQATKAEIGGILRGNGGLPQCGCGGDGVWRRIATPNMSDPTQQCVN